MVAHSSDSIQAVSVPSFVEVQEPDPHLVFSISVSLPSRSYTIQQRYREFVQLEQTLTASCGQPPPVALPPKHRLTSLLSPFRSSTLPPDQAELRRQGLERWLRSILADRDPRWRSTRAFKDFLVAPTTLDDKKTTTTRREWTPTEWTHEFGEVELAARKVRTLVDRRDGHVVANDARAHECNKEAQQTLVDVVARLGQLATGLEYLASRGMTDGEIARRSDLVQRVQGELEDLGRKAANSPRIGSRRHPDANESPSVARQALFGTSSGGTKATTRVLGQGAAGSNAHETAETRPLDDQGVLQLQQRYMDDQDTKLESLTAALRRQRHLGEMINQELALQEDVIDQLERGTDKVTGKIKNASKQMKRL